ncbi:NAD(P)H-dependent flavin oxidoreductase [Facklamia lactis]|uniref:NAD(P)H-dependent flavin oxidoreductase n=1 Tax=Facklamia lactis TaxID=2749967 RepID=UPI0022A7CEB2|nr:DUF561 domain-containing protein [Facklamia lactis]
MKDIRELLGIEYPIIVGAMANISRYELVEAVAEAGGMGFIASGGMSADELREQIKRVKAMTNKPFGINLMLQMTNISELIDVMIEEGITVVSTGAGTPKAYMPKLKAANIKVIPVVPNVKLAKKMDDLGVDAIIAEGQEAGGHIGQVSTLPLVRQVVKAVSVPVIAAGGIADGASMAAMWALGAKGVQMGSLFLTAKECPIQTNFQQKVLEADEMATVVTGRRSRHAVRLLANQMTEQYIQMEYEGASDEALAELTEGSLYRAVYEDNVEFGSMMCGQGIGQIKELRTCREIITDLMNEFNETLSSLTDKVIE